MRRNCSAIAGLRVEGAHGKEQGNSLTASQETGTSILHPQGAKLYQPRMRLKRFFSQSLRKETYSGDHADFSLVINSTDTAATGPLPMLLPQTSLFSSTQLRNPRSMPTRSSATSFLELFLLFGTSINPFLLPVAPRECYPEL